jgi:hypothetical protein
VNPFKSLRESLARTRKSVQQSIDDTFADMDKTLDTFGESIIDLDDDLKNVPEGSEKVTVTEETYPDGRRVTTRTVVRHSTSVTKVEVKK